MRWRTSSGSHGQWPVGVSLWLFAASLFPALGSTVDEVVATEMKNHGIVGISIAIIKDGKISKANG